MKNNLSDQVLMNVLLDSHKFAISSFSNLIIECNNEFLRKDVLSILTKVFQHQKQIYDLMSQKGWYQVQNATQQDITNVKQALSSIQSTMSM